MPSTNNLIFFKLLQRIKVNFEVIVCLTNRNVEENKWTYYKMDYTL